MTSNLRSHYDIVVVGAGPAGASAAYWLARAGADVALLERKHLPRAKTCGDGLTPRAVAQLTDMGLGEFLEGHHRYRGLRANGFGRTLLLPWPSHPSYPGYGYVVTRHDLDVAVARNAAQAGASLFEGVTASPLCEDGRVVGVLAAGRGEPAPVRSRFVVVADGSNSRFGRALGTERVRAWPMGLAIRGYWRSPRSAEPWIDSTLDLRDEQGKVVPGYGWIFPLGDGRVNVGVGLLSNSPRWKGLNTTHLLERYVETQRGAWALEPDPASPAPTGGKLPMGLAVHPRAGAGWIAAGDAAGSINPFNGEGIAYGYETGRLAASALATALAGEGDAALMGYEHALEEAYARYYRLGRLFVRVIGRPAVMQAALTAGMRSERLMGGMVRVMANILRPGAIAVPELGYRAAAVLAAAVPEPGGRAERAAVPEQRPPAPAIGEEPAA